MILSVTPCVGVWIETESRISLSNRVEVTPCVGVWIEMYNLDTVESVDLSHPAWVCGLKPVWGVLHIRH